MSNELSFWNGQPVNAPIFPQMGDAINAHASGFVGGQWPRAASSCGPRMPRMPQGMGDFRPMSSAPMPANCYGQPQALGSGFGGDQAPCEPCIDNGEAFCAYNGVDMGCCGANRGDFW
ncbi:uncharacterized protein LOC6551692 [Drosophila erecta]|uniref:Uncharacterized protein n=1 Tax=Drosophila erecta TaxID=7220 RepID=B3NV92_DROER|nr:uncharacterized protein LOC6551692 [Drosophila erecta]EDV46080.1 uncharacterized protein Dere_GG18398 [Drosophila erecta]